MRLVMRWSAAALMVLAGCGAEEKAAAPAARPPTPVKVLEVQPTELRETGDYLGSLLNRKSVVISPQVGGFVRAIHVRPGQKVSAGAPIVDIDSRQESAAVESARAQVASARASLSLARQTRERTDALFAEGIASAQERDSARAQEDAAVAALKAAEAAAAQREVQLQFFVVRAPVSGVVGEVNSRIGSLVSTATVLTTLSQAEVLEVSVPVPAARARQLKVGTPIEIVDHDGKALLKSSVFFVSPEADARTQLVEVKAVFENSVGLRPNELVRVRLVFSTREALQVPALAVVRQSGQAFVYLVKEKDGKSVVGRHPITLGALGPLQYVVESGLSAGDRIAVSSIQALRDGQAIKPLDDTKE